MPPLFVNHRGAPLTRFGVRYVLAKYCDRARAMCPSLAGKRFHPHRLRHSAAVHLLKLASIFRDDQSLVGSGEPEYDQSLRGDRFGWHASRAHESQTNRQRRTRRRVVIRRDDSRMALGAVRDHQ
jgi:integrase